MSPRPRKKPQASPTTAAPDPTGGAPDPTDGAPDPTDGAPDPGWYVRRARREDAAAIAAGVRELLIELGGTPPSAPALEEATRALVEDPDAGAVIVAQAGEELVGLLAASWQSAIHVPGRYGLIQDLWVEPAWRGRAIGAELLAALVGLARELALARLEVGLPRESFAHIRATEAFYVANCFTPLGPRMRLVIA